MNTIKGKDYSEETIVAALKNHLPAEPKREYKVDNVRVSWAGGGNSSILISILNDSRIGAEMGNFSSCQLPGDMLSVGNARCLANYILKLAKDGK